jgi:Putative zinc-finger
MENKPQDEMQCHEFEALISEALDQALSGPELVRFQAHAGQCSLCGPMLVEAAEGRRWLKSLAPVDPPAMLVHNILAATSGMPEHHAHAQAPAAQPWWENFTASVLTPLWATIRQPRFAMSFGMAFFSLSVVLNIAGVKVSDLRHMDLRPSAIRRTYYETSGRIARYYDNMRFVYEIESQVRELKRATQPVETAPKEKRDDHKNTSGQPDQNQERNYSREDSEPTLASLPIQPPVVTVTTYRRFV